jgi:hypothetical protein
MTCARSSAAALIVAGMLNAGCLSQEAIRAIEGTPGQEGTGITLSRLPRAIKIMATYPASDAQRDVARTRAQEAVAALRQAHREGDDALPPMLAVDIEPDERSRGTVSVMLWDTQTEQIVGNNVYDVEERPRLAEVAMWEDYSAVYVGQGAEVRQGM